jgi:16S rRNA (cytosine1402-N4)-methyltransferase
MIAGRGPGQPAAAGGLARHVPVMLREVLSRLNPKDGATYIDGTFGAGGYTRAILEAANCNVIAIDRDQSAVAAGAAMVEEFSGRLTLVEDRFSRMDEVARALGHTQVDGVVLDIGVSSMQLDQAARGFSFRGDGPLDMRMASSGVSAADVVNKADERDLSRIISVLGEEKFARKVAHAICAARKEVRIETTGKLAEIVRSVVRAKPNEIDPATRTFQALRIYVNDELFELSDALMAAERILVPEGRLVVVSFHSLEDRLVKTFMAARSSAPAVSRHAPAGKHDPATFSLLTKKPLTAADDELESNPRARSAKLRAAERTNTTARDDDPLASLTARFPRMGV